MTADKGLPVHHAFSLVKSWRHLTPSQHDTMCFNLIVVSAFQHVYLFLAAKGLFICFHRVVGVHQDNRDAQHFALCFLHAAIPQVHSNRKHNKWHGQKKSMKQQTATMHSNSQGSQGTLLFGS